MLYSIGHGQDRSTGYRIFISLFYLDVNQYYCTSCHIKLDKKKHYHIHKTIPNLAQEVPIVFRRFFNIIKR